MSTLLDLRAYNLGLEAKTPEAILRAHDEVASLVNVSGNRNLWKAFDQGMIDADKPRASRGVG